jgi:hypothetical protein
MRSLREFAQFVGKPQQPISPRNLADHLFQNINSVRELIQAFEGYSQPFAIDAMEVQPTSGIVPFQIGMQVTRILGYRLSGIRWRILRDGQQVAVYDIPISGPPQTAHTFIEPGNYTVEAMTQGIGKDGYATATKSVTVVAKPKVVTPPPPPPPSNRLKLILSPTELVPNTLRIKSVEWKLTPFWNPSQVINSSGAEAEVTLPNPPPSEARVSVELRIRCEVAGVLNGIPFTHQEFEGFVEPFPATVGLVSKPLTAGWAAFWNMGPVEDGDNDPNNNPFGVVVVAKLINIV